MPYLGNVPAEAYTNTVKDSFNGDASTTAFTLSQPSTTNNLRVVVENVIQDPTVAYTVSGTTLTFTSAPPVGTANIYAVHLGPAVQTAVPPAEITSATNFTDGITVDKDGAAVITADRASSDGTIIDLQKDGSGVGTLGSNGGAPYFSGTENGIKIVGPVATTVDALGPSTATGNNRDNSMDLGWSGNRFNDLYLGGGVYVGGTGSANYLDDYEEGTWTPVLIGSSTNPTVTYSVQYGRYTKIGRIVYVEFDITMSAKSGGSGNATISGLPFTKSADNPRFCGDLGMLRGGRSSALNSTFRQSNFAGTVLGNDTDIELAYTDTSGNPQAYDVSSHISTGRIVGSLQYVV